MAERKPVGRFAYERPPTQYESFMEAEKIPVIRGESGVRDVRELALGPWDRLGCEGAFVQLRGLNGLQGAYVMRLAPGTSVAAEKHLYEEIFYVVEGDGATRVWTDDDPGGAVVEWRTNSVFTVPLNAWHELVNTGTDPALVIVITNAPPVFELYQNPEFVFNDEYRFQERTERCFEDYRRTSFELGVDPLTHRAWYTAAIIPDAVGMELPYDGQRGADYRHMELQMAGNFSAGFVGEYPGVSFGRTHRHLSGPLLICMDGEGYTLTWPESAGTRPWAEGNADQVQRIDYRQGGMMSPVPGDIEWYHGHYNTSGKPLRVLAHTGGYPRRVPGEPGDTVVDSNADIKDGGKTIGAADEDPAVREMFDAEVAGSEGA